MISSSSGYLGIDLGTCNTRAYYRGNIVYHQPSLVARETDKKRTVNAVGSDAQDLFEQGVTGLEFIHPIKEGYITDFEATKSLLQHVCSTSYTRFYLKRPRIFLSYPCCISNIDKRALTEAAESAGVSKRVLLVEKPLLSAFGCGLPIVENRGQMIVDIGGGTTDIAVLCSGGIVVRHSVRVGGGLMDESIMRYMKQHHQILISAKRAEEIKKDLGSAVEQTALRKMPVMGMDINTGIGVEMQVNNKEIYTAIKAPCMAIVEAVKWVLEQTPEDLIVDIMEAGVTLTGGGSSLYEIAGFLSEQIGLPVRQADKCTESAINGLGYLIENQDFLRSEDLTELIL